MKLRATEVFTPGSFPTHTYVERGAAAAEHLLRNTLETPGQIASISGPSKSGKTVLVERVVGRTNLISIAGARIISTDVLWNAILDELQEPHHATATDTDSARDVSTTGTVRGAGVSGLAKFEGTSGSTVETSAQGSTSITVLRRGFVQVVEKLANTDYVLLVDDFHYMRRDVQVEVAKSLKEAAQKGIKVCVASVPHRADDVVRALPELIGRVRAIDLPYWTREELLEIAAKGFAALNAEVDKSSQLIFAVEAAGSPQLMQQVCLETCFYERLRERSIEARAINLDASGRAGILEQAASSTNCRPVVEAINTGPRRRGTPRRTYKLKSGSSGDAYGCILHAIASDPPALSFSYENLMSRIADTCDADAPKGSSVTGACLRMHRIAAKQFPNQRALEWDDQKQVLDIPDPYLLFFLRWSGYLQSREEGTATATLAAIADLRQSRTGPNRTTLTKAEMIRLDLMGLEKLIEFGSGRGYVTYRDVVDHMPDFDLPDDDLYRWLIALDKAGVVVVAAEPETAT